MFKWAVDFSQILFVPQFRYFLNETKQVFQHFCRLIFAIIIYIFCWNRPRIWFIVGNMSFSKNVVLCRTVNSLVKMQLTEVITFSTFLLCSNVLRFLSRYSFKICYNSIQHEASKAGCTTYTEQLIIFYSMRISKQC